MSNDKVSTILELIIPEILEKIKINRNTLNISDINAFYSSRLYKEMEDSSTELWHYSPSVLFDMYVEELTTGNISYPESAT